MTQKIELRRYYRQTREAIPSVRRTEASEELCSYFQKEIKEEKILSFSSFGSEISTDQLNRWILEKKTLFLPRVEEDQLAIYRIQDLNLDLERSCLGPWEPNAKRCEKVFLEEIEIALIPGLAFDLSHHRLGYGKGHYDRLLSLLRCTRLGLAFSEQKAKELPKDDWDIALHKVAFF